MALNPPNLFFVLIFSILPIAAISLGIEGYGLLRLGEFAGEVGRLQIPPERIFKYELFYGIASLLVMFGGALLLQSMGPSFNLRAPFSVCFILVALSYTPILMLRIPDALPQINTWIFWAVGALLAVRIYYHGVGMWLKPEQTKGFGILIMLVIYTVVLSGLVHFASVQVLHGKLLRNVYSEQVR